MIKISMIAFFILFPALVMYLCDRYAFLDKLGAVVICYIAGGIIGNTGILPGDFFKIQDTFLTLTIPVALPLLFFSLNIRGWFRLAGKTMISFFSSIAAVIISTTIAFLIFHESIGNESWKVSGMLIGCYTGGTPNLAAIGTALRMDPTIYLAVHTSDVVVGALYIFMLISFMQRLLLKVLPPFKSAGNSDAESGNEGFMTSFRGIRKEGILPLLGALALAIVIFAVGGGLTLIVPKEISMVVAILTITTLGVVFSFVPAVRKIRMTFQLGYFIILIFSLVVSSMADLSKLINTAPAMIGYVSIAVFGTAIIHLIFSAIFRVDADTHIITSTALVFSPPFVPMVAAALKNKEVVVSGVLTGILGWVVGNYLGISIAYTLKNFFM
ncbi:MAG: hypothetical protein CVV44_18845 [Spirochaetae bacterium HGW-Spirochaetae-1]|nr:MAG: hypothetical protein CVV44_18845 [Spirochaetae bacterium HGW-Spirochaetae-1]